MKPFKAFIEINEDGNPVTDIVHVQPADFANPKGEFMQVGKTLMASSLKYARKAAQQIFDKQKFTAQ